MKGTYYINIYSDLTNKEENHLKLSHKMKGKVNPSSYKTSVTVDNSKDFSN
jgi:hypothetical protein